MTGTPLPRPAADAGVLKKRGTIVLLVFFIGAMGVCLVVGVIAMLFMLRNVDPVEPPIEPSSTTPPPLTSGSLVVTPLPLAAPAEEKEAQALFEEAEKIVLRFEEQAPAPPPAAAEPVA